MDRRELLAGVSSVASGFVAGCFGVLGSGGGDGGDEEDEDGGDDGDPGTSGDGGGPVGGGVLGGCSISADSAEDLLPEEGDGFTEEAASTGSASGEDVESQAFATYTGEDRDRYVFVAAKYSSRRARRAAEEESEDENRDGPLLLVSSGPWVVAAAGDEGTEESRVRDLLRLSPIDESCVREAEAPG